MFYRYGELDGGKDLSYQDAALTVEADDETGRV